MLRFNGAMSGRNSIDFFTQIHHDNVCVHSPSCAVNTNNDPIMEIFAFAQAAINSRQCIQSIEHLTESLNVMLILH